MCALPLCSYFGVQMTTWIWFVFCEWEKALHGPSNLVFVKICMLSVIHKTTFNGIFFCSPNFFYYKCWVLHSGDTEVPLKLSASMKRRKWNTATVAQILQHSIEFETPFYVALYTVDVVKINVHLTNQLHFCLAYTKNVHLSDFINKIGWLVNLCGLVLILPMFMFSQFAMFRSPLVRFSLVRLDLAVDAADLLGTIWVILVKWNLMRILLRKTIAVIITVIS